MDECVETLARREYEESLRRYLSSEESDELGERIELLRLFLESADFRKLRAESERWLLKGRKVKFVLSLEEGKPRVQMMVE